MAGPDGYIHLKIADANGFESRKDAYFTLAAASTTADDLATVCAGLLSRVQASSGGRIVEAEVRLYESVAPYASESIEPSSIVSRNAVLSFKDESSGLPWDYAVPAVSTTVFSGGSLDMAEGHTLDALADYLEGAGTLPSGFAFTSNEGGNLLGPAGGFPSGRRINRKSIAESQSLGT